MSFRFPAKLQQTQNLQLAGLAAGSTAFSVACNAAVTSTELLSTHFGWNRSGWRLM